MTYTKDTTSNMTKPGVEQERNVKHDAASMAARIDVVVKNNTIDIATETPGGVAKKIKVIFCQQEESQNGSSMKNAAITHGTKHQMCGKEGMCMQEILMLEDSTYKDCQQQCAIYYHIHQGSMCRENEQLAVEEQSSPTSLEDTINWNYLKQQQRHYEQIMKICEHMGEKGNSHQTY